MKRRHKLVVVLSYLELVNLPPLLSIVIPAFNEERRLPRALKATIAYLKAQSYPSEILVVTDGSTDRTAAVAREFALDFPALRVLEFKDNHGKGFGVKTGMLAAVGRFRLFMDADYAVPIEFVADFLERAQAGADIVIGSRTHSDTQLEEKQRFPRRQLANLFGLLQHSVLRLPYRDTQCGFKLFTGKAAESFFPLQTFECAYFDAELLYIAHISGAVVEEAPVRWHHDQETRLPIGFRRSLELLVKLLTIERLHKNDFRSTRWDATQTRDKQPVAAPEAR